MLSSKIRLGVFVFAAVSVLAAPVSAFADGEGTAEPWTYNQPSQWQYNPGTQDHPSKPPVTLGQPQAVDTTVTIHSGVELGGGDPIYGPPTIKVKLPGLCKLLNACN